MNRGMTKYLALAAAFLIACTTIFTLTSSSPPPTTAHGWSTCDPTNAPELCTAPNPGAVCAHDCDDAISLEDSPRWSEYEHLVTVQDHGYDFLHCLYSPIHNIIFCDDGFTLTPPA